MAIIGNIPYFQTNPDDFHWFSHGKKNMFPICRGFPSHEDRFGFFPNPSFRPRQPQLNCNASNPGRWMAKLRTRDGLYIYYIYRYWDCIIYFWFYIGLWIVIPQNHTKHLQTVPKITLNQFYPTSKCAPVELIRNRRLDGQFIHGSRR